MGASSAAATMGVAFRCRYTGGVASTMGVAFRYDEDYHAPPHYSTTTSSAHRAERRRERRRECRWERRRERRREAALYKRVRLSSAADEAPAGSDLPLAWVSGIEGAEPNVVARQQHRDGGDDAGNHYALLETEVADEMVGPNLKDLIIRPNSLTRPKQRGSRRCSRNNIRISRRSWRRKLRRSRSYAIHGSDSRTCSVSLTSSAHYKGVRLSSAADEAPARSDLPLVWASGIEDGKCKTLTDGSGSFKTMAACVADKSCEAPPPPTFACDDPPDEKCKTLTDGSGSFKTMAACVADKSCGTPPPPPPPPTFACGDPPDGKCKTLTDGSGSFKTMAACVADKSYQYTTLCGAHDVDIQVGATEPGASSDGDDDHDDDRDEDDAYYALLNIDSAAAAVFDAVVSAFASAFGAAQNLGLVGRLQGGDSAQSNAGRISSSDSSSSDDEPAPRRVRLRPMTAREKERSKKQDEEREKKRVVKEPLRGDARFALRTACTITPVQLAASTPPRPSDMGVGGVQVGDAGVQAWELAFRERADARKRPRKGRRPVLETEAEINAYYNATPLHQREWEYRQANWPAKQIQTTLDRAMPRYAARAIALEHAMDIGLADRLRGGNGAGEESDNGLSGTCAVCGDLLRSRYSQCEGTCMFKPDADGDGDDDGAGDVSSMPDLVSQGDGDMPTPEESSDEESADEAKMEQERRPRQQQQKRQQSTLTVASTPSPTKRKWRPRTSRQGAQVADHMRAQKSPRTVVAASTRFGPRVKSSIADNLMAVAVASSVTDIDADYRRDVESDPCHRRRMATRKRHLATYVVDVVRTNMFRLL